MDQTYGPVVATNALAWYDNAFPKPDVHNAPSSPWSVPANWEVTAVIYGPLGGKTTIYRNKELNQVMIVPMGTKGTGDWAGWASNITSYGESQWDDADTQQKVFAAADAAIRSVNQPSNAKLIIAGDSKGGALAQFITATLLQDDQNLNLSYGIDFDKLNNLKAIPQSNIAVIGRVAPGVQNQLNSTVNNSP